MRTLTSSSSGGECCNLSLGLATKARGLQGCGSRGRPGSHFTCSREYRECEGMNLHTPKGTPMLGVGVPKGLSNFQSAIAKVKTHRLKELFTSLETYCHFILVPSRSSITPFYPSIVLQAREHAPTPCPFVVFSLGLTFEPLKELGVRQYVA
jgi:hypothetical protein